MQKCPRLPTRAYLAKGLRTARGIQSSDDMVQWFQLMAWIRRPGFKFQLDHLSILHVSLLKQSPIHEWLKQQKRAVIRFWRSEVQVQIVNRVDSFWELSGRNGSRPLPWLLLAICGFLWRLPNLCYHLYVVFSLCVCMSKFSLCISAHSYWSRGPPYSRWHHLNSLYYIILYITYIILYYILLYYNILYNYIN